MVSGGYLVLAAAKETVKKASAIGHFRVAVNLTVKARLSAKLFI